VDFACDDDHPSVRVEGNFEEVWRRVNRTIESRARKPTEWQMAKERMRAAQDPH
jgi:hypothetical protein